MQLILKGGASSLAITGDQARKCINLSALARAFDINPNSLSTLVNRDGYTIEAALTKLLNEQ